MNISGTVKGFFQSVGSNCYSTQQTLLSVAFQFREFRNNPDFFQKIGQVAFAIIQLIMKSYPSTGFLAKFSFSVSTVSMHDFYRYTQYPRSWFFPINAQVINEAVVLEDLTNLLAPSDDQENEYRDVIKRCLEDQLTMMAGNDDAYRNLNEFINVLETRLKSVKDEDDDVVFQGIDLSDFKSKNPDIDTAQWMHNTPTLEKITNFNWIVVDIMNVAFCLKEWNLFNTAKCVETLGQYHAFHWVKNQTLEVCLIGGVCTGFAWKLLESVRKLRDEALTVEEKRQVRWDIVTSVAELTFFSTIFLNLTGRTQINDTYVNLLAIGAKSLGLFSIVTRPRHQFFQEPVAVSAS